ncbi:uncharacterized protein LOC107681113 isoform X1 [Sinocyclocheilus anshuiensis]|uniref:uncharacterized protein LOC107681113 isoform X1 n=2 Tax=Sinocyclocheilus anshuiensis TaxID=1608454 RepID=UPI0007B9953A|nr:PREDICTED: uncharacterized protein LOC107681113 isoform X1 [Sinocyclocheilus anshuiensis]
MDGPPCHKTKHFKMQSFAMNTINSLFGWILALGVLMIPVLCQDEESVITVCQEEDNDLRVDCLLEPRHNYHTDYEFSMSKGQKEIIINTNISGIMPEPKFRHNTFVTELEPYGFRLTIMSFTVTENTTFICKVTKIQKTLSVELASSPALPSVCFCWVILGSIFWFLCASYSYGKPFKK